MNLHELLRSKQSERAKIASQAKAMYDKGKSNGLTDDEESQLQGLLDQADALKLECDDLQAKIDAKAKAEKELDERVRQLGVPPHRRSAAADPGDPHARITDVRPRFEDDPKKGFRGPIEFFSKVLSHPPGLPPIEASDERLRFLGGGFAKNRAEMAAGSDEQSTFNDPYGGFLVPAGLAPDVLQVEAETDPIAGRTTIVPMATPRVTFNARVDKNHASSVSGGLTVTRRPEAEAASASRQKYEQIELNAYSLFGLTYITEEQISDSPQSVAALIAAGFSDEFRSRIIQERLEGTGVGEFLGVKNSSCTVEVAKETGQANDTIVYENVLKMRARAWRYEDAIWMANHDTIPQLMLMNQTIGNGGVVVWQPSARDDHPDMLLGRPIFFTEYCETLGDAGDLILCNWSQYLEGIYAPLQSAESIHVRFINHERTFKFWLRNAGAPWWRSPLTPKKSSQTLSPFVKLGQR